MLFKEEADDFIQAGLGGLDGARMAGVIGDLPGFGRVVRAPVVQVQARAAGLGQAAHAAAAVPAADPAAVGVGAGRGGVAAQAGPVAAGAVLGADVLGGIPGGPVHDLRVGGLG